MPERGGGPDLHVERWLLELKVACEVAGLEARVRAFGEKGGRRVGLTVRDDAGHVEIRYQKQLLGVAVVAAADDVGTASRAIVAHREFIAGHGKLRQNGLRRFGRRGLGTVGAVHGALVRDAGLLDRARARLPAVGAGEEIRPAVIAVRLPVLLDRHEIYTGASIQGRSRHVFAAFEDDGKLVDLSELLPPVKERHVPKRPADRENGRTNARGSVADDIVEGAIELVADAALIAALDPTTPRVAGFAADAVLAPVAELDELEAVGDSAGEAIGEAVGGGAGDTLEGAAEVGEGGGPCSDGSVGGDCGDGGVDCGDADCDPG